MLIRLAGHGEIRRRFSIKHSSPYCQELLSHLALTYMVKMDKRRQVYLKVQLNLVLLHTLDIEITLGVKRTRRRRCPR